jgi:hypothetical protein
VGPIPTRRAWFCRCLRQKIAADAARQTRAPASICRICHCDCRRSNRYPRPMAARLQRNAGYPVYDLLFGHPTCGVRGWPLPGLLATVLSAFLAWIVFIPPELSFEIAPGLSCFPASSSAVGTAQQDGARRALESDHATCSDSWLVTKCIHPRYARRRAREIIWRLYNRPKL